MERLKQLLSGECGSYILPFLWMKGAPREAVLAEIESIDSCGIREICVESRPHPDFAGPQWWEDLDMVMDEARRRGMRVWVLDDRRFPTGYANGAFENEHAEKAKWYLAERHMDMMGPARDVRVLVQPFLPKDARLLSILAFPKPDTETTDVSPKGVLDLTGTLADGFIRCDLPEGAYRLFVLFTTQTGGGRPHYMNLIDTASVRVLIDAVYEPHYARYAADFGETFAGFFSDEPELGNTPGYDFHDTLGKPGVRLPWSAELESALRAVWGDSFYENLPALWFGVGEQTGKIRYDYMNAMTRLVGKCLSEQLGAWCEARGVEYIGHIIEDDNAHGRMGCSVGHYFREQRGQHRSGIDVVHHQILPGFTGRVHRWIEWEGDGEFFHFGLAKLGASAARLYPHMRGRALCEIFGNYGWAEGVGLMKWLTDHMLVRGINHFVPHAFSPDFPDRDCPPHFYAQGNNPQFGLFRLLMRYMNRAAHLLSGGQAHTDAAVLYHADAEWAGRAMLFQKPMRALMEHQLGCDVIPADLLRGETACIIDGELVINGNAYASLVIPGCEWIPEEAAGFIGAAAVQGLQVLFVEERPKGMEGVGRVIRLAELSAAVKAAGKPEISLDAYLPNLRFLCVKREAETVYMFFNESVAETTQTRVEILNGTYKAISWYDPAVNSAKTYGMAQNRFDLVLAAGESVFVVLHQGKHEEAGAPFRVTEEKLVINWTVTAPSGPAGIYRYEALFPANPAPRAEFYFHKVSDGAVVWINGILAGTVLGNSGYVQADGLLREGENTIAVEIPTTLVFAMKDPVSAFMQIQPTGIGDMPILKRYE